MDRRIHIPQKKRILLLLAVCVLLIASAGSAYAQGMLDIPWWTVDGGGGLSQGGDFTLQGGIGQADAGSMQAGEYALNGGFWSGGSDMDLLKVFLPLIQK